MLCAPLAHLGMPRAALAHLGAGAPLVPSRAMASSSAVPSTSSPALVWPFLLGPRELSGTATATSGIFPLLCLCLAEKAAKGPGAAGTGLEEARADLIWLPALPQLLSTCEELDPELAATLRHFSRPAVDVELEEELELF